MKDLKMYPTVNNEKTAQKLKTLRKAHNLSVRDVQGACGGISAQAVYCWENEEISSLPSLDNMLVLSMLYDTDVDDLIALNYVAADPKDKNYADQLNELSEHFSTHQVRKLAARQEYCWNIDKLIELGNTLNHKAISK